MSKFFQEHLRATLITVVVALLIVIVLSISSLVEGALSGTVRELTGTTSFDEYVPIEIDLAGGHLTEPLPSRVKLNEPLNIGIPEKDESIFISWHGEMTVGWNVVFFEVEPNGLLYIYQEESDGAVTDREYEGKVEGPIKLKAIWGES